MGRPLRMIVPGQAMIITMRCFQARFFLRPSKRVNAIVAGVLGKAQQRYHMEIHYFVVLSNHLHLYVTPESPQQLEAFQRFLASNLSKEIGALRGWRGGIFRSRYSAIHVTDEEEAQVARLVYLMAHGVKEGLVPRPQDWPGLQPLKELLRGQFRIHGGRWIQRSALYAADRAYRSNRKAKQPRLRKKPPRRIDFTEEVPVELTPIPCWAHLEPSQYAAALRELLSQIAHDHAELIATVPRDWKQRILQRDPIAEPARYKRSARPFCHAATPEAWWEFKRLYEDFRSAFRLASDLLRQGSLEAFALFPEGAFPPRLHQALRLQPEAAL